MPTNTIGGVTTDVWEETASRITKYCVRDIEVSVSNQ